MADLRSKVARGSALLIGRQALGLAINLVGLVALTRLIGPTAYGLYASAAGVLLFLFQIGRLGVETYLVRREAEPDDHVYDQALTLVLTSGLVLAIGTVALLPLVAGWMFITPLIVLILALPLSLVSVPSLARLERELIYQRIAVYELASQVVYFAVALPAGLAGAGVWAPVLGYWAGQLVLAGASLRSLGRPARVAWSPPLLREMLAYGVPLSVSAGIWFSRALVNPLIVGRFLGPDAVAFANLAIRLTQSLSFVGNATWRVATVAFSKIQRDPEKLRRGLSVGMAIQTLAVGALFAAFALVARWLVPLAFGSAWSDAVDIFPFVATALVINAPFSIQVVLLYVLKRNLAVATFHAVAVALFAGSAWLLVPRVGLVGYGLAELASVLAYLVLDRIVRRSVDPPYRDTLVWLAALLPPLWATYLLFPLGLALWVPLAALAFTARFRAMLASYRAMV